MNAPKPLRAFYGASDRQKSPIFLGTLDTACSVCGEPQFDTSSGASCKNGHGGAPSAETSRKNTAKSMISPGDRPQAIFTPKALYEPILNVWPEIALDPCGHMDSTVPALRKFVGKQVQATNKKGELQWKKDGSPKLVWVADGPDGLVEPWPDFTYGNPIFECLDDWMWKAHGEAKAGAEIMLLCPVRTHRVWWCDVASQCSAIAWLKPVTFDTYDQAFPAPLAMLYWGVCVDEFKEAFRGVSCRVGGPL